jgi:hypothetical protein
MGEQPFSRLLSDEDASTSANQAWTDAELITVIGAAFGGPEFKERP